MFHHIKVDRIVISNLLYYFKNPLLRCAVCNAVSIFWRIHGALLDEHGAITGSPSIYLEMDLWRGLSLGLSAIGVPRQSGVGFVMSFPSPFSPDHAMHFLASAGLFKYRPCQSSFTPFFPEMLIKFSCIIPNTSWASTFLHIWSSCENRIGPFVKKLRKSISENAASSE